MFFGAAIVVCSACPLAADDGFVPFHVEWPREEVRSPADLSFLLDLPAGRDGPIRVARGHLVRPDGKRFRIWGVNLTTAAALPAQGDSPLLAGHLARLGINCVRFHFLDLPSPRGLIDPKPDHTRSLDPERLDRLDRLVAELKKRGIYTDLNLNVGRRYEAGDGVRDAELLGVAKGATCLLYTSD
ncbi:MAG: hypothetical protein QUU85_15610, partial [Candidatus Eisenbacteria bacterium]|nr:hypothetical protein [Candidatus Eisenbacteria bacterium]